jgi:hypothetical protein
VLDFKNHINLFIFNSLAERVGSYPRRSMASITCRNYIATDAKFTRLAAHPRTLAVLPL